MIQGQIEVHRCAWVDVACVPARRAVDQKSYGASCRILPATLDKCVVFNWLNDKDRREVGVPGCRSEAEDGAKLLIAETRRRLDSLIGLCRKEDASFPSS